MTPHLMPTALGRFLHRLGLRHRWRRVATFTDGAARWPKVLHVEACACGAERTITDHAHGFPNASSPIFAEVDDWRRRHGESAAPRRARDH